MSTFTAASSSTVTDLHKRVRYSTGLVLGVDEFEQEQAYLLERDRLHTRALHGYGTVYGLRVELGETSTGKTSNELVVTSGLAVVPSGQHVCVGRPQCASLDDWVNTQDSGNIEPHLKTSGGGDPELPVYVVLCYRECETDTVPIPGEPCRSADDSAAPSRIAEDFELQLRLTPPVQPSEEATRAFGAFLWRIQVTEHEDRALNESEFVGKVKGEITRITDQIATEGASVTPSETDEPIRLPASDAHAFLTRAFRLWSLHAGRGIDTSSNRCGVLAGNDSDCVRLGTVNLTLQPFSSGYKLKDVSGQDISVDNRPVLLETRLLQEYLAQGSLDPETIRRTLATVSVETPKELRLWFHYDATLKKPPKGSLEMKVNGESTDVSKIERVGSNSSLNVFDLTLNSPVEPGDRIAVQVQLGKVKEKNNSSSLLDRLDAEDAPDYLDRTEDTVAVYTVAPTSTLRLGDLQDVKVNPEQPTQKQILEWDPDDSVWQNKVVEKPDTLSIKEVAETLPTLPFATAEVIDLDSLAKIYEGVGESTEMVDAARDVRDQAAEGIQGRAIPIRVRFHLNTHENISTEDNTFDIVDDFAVRIFSERKDPMSKPLYLKEEGIKDPNGDLVRERISRNVFVLFVRENAVHRRPYLRLRFDTENIEIHRRKNNGNIDETYTASDWIEERPVKWLGHDGTHYVTVFASWTPVGGDLSGPHYAPQVTGIQGTPVSDSLDPSRDDVLITRDGSEWDSGKLDLDDLSDVDAPQPSVGEVLTWQKESEQESGRWVPDSGGTSTLDTDYVQTNEKTDEPYRIVAAGTVTPEANNPPKVKAPKYGKLKAQWEDPDIGLFLLGFDGYKIPGDTHSYVVKGTPKPQEPVVQPQQPQNPAHVGFMFAVWKFTPDDGIIVQCIKQMIKPTDLAVDTIVEPAPFMVEISRIEGRQG